MLMNNHLDPESLKIPAYMRKKAIVRQSRQKLILTALDRKQAGLSVHSQKALAPVKVKEKSYSNVARKTVIKKATATSMTPRQNKFLSDLYHDSQKNSIGVFERSQQPQTSRTKKSKSRFLRNLFPAEDEIETLPRPQPKPQPAPQHAAPVGFVEIHPVGHVTAYIAKIQVAIIKLQKPLRQGDLIQITADKLLFQQPIDSMQINRKPVKIAKKGSEIGLKVSREPQINGTVYKVLS